MVNENDADGLVRRNYKDSLFCCLFRDKSNALSLYNALCDSNCTDASDLNAIDAAIDDCIRRGILDQFLRKHKAEVKNMFLFEYDEDLHNRTLREEGREEGIYSAVDLLRDCGLDDKVIKEKLIGKFKLTDQQAQNYLSHGFVTA